MGTNLDVGAAPAVDEVFKQAVTDQDASDPLPTALDWQDDYEGVRSKRAKSKDVEATVDVLLATDWE